MKTVQQASRRISELRRCHYVYALLDEKGAPFIHSFTIFEAFLLLEGLCMKKRQLCAYAVLLFTFCVISPPQNALDLSKLTARLAVDGARDGVVHDVHAVRTEKERVDASWKSQTSYEVST